MHPIPQELYGRPFTTAEAAAYGVTPKMLAGRRFVEVFSGVHRTADTVDCFDLRVRAAVLVLPPDAAVSHVTSLRWRDYDAVPAWPLHFSTNQRLHVERPGIVVHRRQGRLSSNLVREIAILGPDRTFVDAATQLDGRQLLRAGDWLVSSGHTDVLDLRAYAVMSHLDGVEHARRIAPFVRDRVESVRESDVRWVVLTYGLPAPEPNRNLVNAAGEFLARGDLAYLSFKVLVEFDGWQHERDPVQRQRDHLRRERLEAEGWRVIIVTAADFKDERAIAWRIYKALAQRGYRGPRPRFGG